MVLSVKRIIQMFTLTVFYFSSNWVTYFEICIYDVKRRIYLANIFIFTGRRAVFKAGEKSRKWEPTRPGHRLNVHCTHRFGPVFCLVKTKRKLRIYWICWLKIGFLHENRTKDPLVKNGVPFRSVISERNATQMGKSSCGYSFSLSRKTARTVAVGGDFNFFNALEVTLGSFYVRDLWWRVSSRKIILEVERSWL